MLALTWFPLLEPLGFPQAALTFIQDLKTQWVNENTIPFNSLLIIL